MKTKLAIALLSAWLGTSLPALAATASIRGDLIKTSVGIVDQFSTVGAPDLSDSRYNDFAGVFAASWRTGPGAVRIISLSGDADHQTYAEALYSDDFMFAGAAGTRSRVQVTGSARLNASGAGSGALSFILIDTVSGIPLVNDHFFAKNEVLNSSLSHSFIIIANRRYSYELFAVGGNYGAGTFFATLEPEISFSDAVPEPAVWAQLIAGFGLAGAIARRRRAEQAFAW